MMRGASSRAASSYYNNIRLNHAIGYVAPRVIHTERDRKLAAARQQRRIRRQQLA
jgi:hypothetical protein